MAATFILFYDGELSVNNDFFPSYAGGRNRPLVVPVSTSLHQLKERISRALNYNPLISNVSLVARYPVDGSFVAMEITDDEVCNVVLSAAKRNAMVIYVAVEQIQPQGHVPEQAVIEDYGHIVQITQGMSTFSIDTVRTNRVGSSSRSNRRASTSEVPDYLSRRQTIFRDDTLDNIRQHFSPSSPIPEINVNDNQYESMNSSSSHESTDNEDDPNIDHLGNNDVQEIIRQNTFTRINQDDNMHVDNTFIRTCLTAREWDENIQFDGPTDNIHINDEMKIPDILESGMIFQDKFSLQFAISGWSLNNNVEFHKVKSDKSKYTVECVQSKHATRRCRWRLHASKSKRLGGSWKISSVDHRHICSNPIMSSGHRQCTSKFISYFIIPAIRNQLDLKPKEIMSRIQAKFNINISYMKAWDARRKALKAIFGSWEESYKSLHRFMYTISLVIEGTVYSISSDTSNRFKSLFWSFGPSIAGWSYCRPVISLDGTFLLGRYKGTLLCAVGVDANNGLFPLAFAVVDSESNETWGWFLKNLHDLITPIRERENLCFISDRHSGIIRGCREIFPNAVHRHCLRHLRENFKKAIRSMGVSEVESMCDKLYSAGSTDDLNTFERHMDDFKNLKVEVYEWLIQRNPRNWSLIHDEGYRYGMMTTNASECFNNVLKRARGLPIQGMVTAIFYNIVSIFMKRGKEGAELVSGGDSIFLSKPRQQLRTFERQARRLPQPTCINNTEYEVLDHTCRSYRVDIINVGNYKCSCNRPALYHMPCHHVIAVLGANRVDHSILVSTYYTLQNYLTTYEGRFHVIPSRDAWPPFDESEGIVELLPPVSRRRAGRPRTQRIRNTMDEGRSTSNRLCGYCGIAGHNRSTCQSNPANYRS